MKQRLSGGPEHLWTVIKIIVVIRFYYNYSQFYDFKGVLTLVTVVRKESTKIVIGVCRLIQICNTNVFIQHVGNELLCCTGLLFTKKSQS